VVLKRPAGSSGRFGEHAGLPTDLAEDGESKGRRSKVRKSRPATKVSEKEARKAAAEFEREQRRQDAERRKEEEAARAKERARREDLVAKAQAALDKAQRKHEKRSETLLAERAAIEERIEAEDARWETERQGLTKALRRARD
jgi:hypothetical protein